MSGILDIDWLDENGYTIENENIITHSDGTRLAICLNCENVISEDNIDVDNFDNEICPHCNANGWLNDCWNDSTIHVRSFLKYHLTH